jgi:NarL family two-component system response regulator LiaR
LWHFTELLMRGQDKIRVVTVDDHEIMRGGVKFTLLAFDDLQFVGEARSGEDALRVCDEVLPDVVLMDMKMSKMDGIATTKIIKDAHPRVQVVMLTTFHDKQLVQQAMKAGAVGYVLKDASKEELAETIRAAHAGRTTLSSEAANDLVQAHASPAGVDSELSEREREVLVLIAKGLSNKQIADSLHRSPYTIRAHVSQIMAKLGAANRAEAAALAIQRGLVD